jgi:hypothetical protein
MHIKYVHVSDRPVSCEKCAYKGKTKADIKSHMVTHETNRTKEKCKFTCGYQSKSKIALKAHYNRSHGNAPLYSCPHCPELFSNGTAVTKHSEGKHGTVKTKARKRFVKDKFSGLFIIEGSLTQNYKEEMCSICTSFSLRPELPPPHSCNTSIPM